MRSTLAKAESSLCSPAYMGIAAQDKNLEKKVKLSMNCNSKVRVTVQNLIEVSNPKENTSIFKFLCSKHAFDSCNQVLNRYI